MLQLPTICPDCLAKLDENVANYQGTGTGRFQIYCPETHIFVTVFAEAGEVRLIRAEGPLTPAQADIYASRPMPPSKQ